MLRDRPLDEARINTAVELGSNPVLAHEVLFPHRHPDASSDAHRQLIRDIHGDEARRLVEGFRGLGKSTNLEECAVIRAALRQFKYMVVVGASYSRACDRLAAIKREIEQNDTLTLLYGSLRGGGMWQEGKIVLSSGICIEAMGRDQSMVGMKHLDSRPDAALIDDVEDPEEVRTDAEREQTWKWFLMTFLPSLDHPLRSWVRVLGTRRGHGSLPERLEKEGWPTSKFPIEYIDEDGDRQAMWPAKFPLEAIDEMKKTYRGNMDTWYQEFMCVAVSAENRAFTRDMFRVEPRARSWEAVYAMIDPARTTNRTSATTGWAVWSWINNRLVVWAAGAEMLLPDQIVDLAFAIAREFNPIWIGVEEDGLNEWLLQPLRQEQTRRGISIPLRSVRAPRGKLDFIRGLQPFFSAHEVIFSNPLPDLEAQLLSFPSGRIDAPNALAYALTMRPAAPIYGEFTEACIADELEPDPSRPIFLAANATRSTTAAILCQHYGSRLYVYADWVLEGSPAECVPTIFGEANLLGDAALRPRRPRYDWSEQLKLPTAQMTWVRRPPVWVIPPHHGDQWNNVGLEQAARRLPAAVSRGVPEVAGREDLRAGLSRMVGGLPTIQVSRAAVWTLRAFTGGYARGVAKGGGLAEFAEEGAYRVLMEGLESFAGITARVTDDEEMGTQPVAYTRSGQAYRSAMPERTRR